MPEHDLFDLDAAFASLERDIATVSSPRGAGHAVASARHRRQTRRVSAATLVALATIGAGAAVVRGHGDGSPEPAGQPLPTAAPLSVQRIDDATRGWTGAWQPVDSDNSVFVRQQVNVSCRLLVQDQTVAQPTRIVTGTFLTADHSRLVEFRAGIRGVEGAAQEYDATVAAFDACAGHTDRTFSYPGGAEVTVAALPAPRGGATVVSVATRYADRAGILLLGRVDAVPTSAQAAALADLTLAATMDDATYTETVPQSGVGRIDPTQTAGQVWAQALEPALVGWSTPWAPLLPQGASQAPPEPSLPACVGTPEGNDHGNGLTVNVGRDGFEWVHWFASEARATQAVDDITQALAGCSTPYAVHTVTLPSGRPVVVAVGSQQVLWFTRVASHVLILQLPSGGTPPPDDVSVKVGALLEHVLQQPATTTMSPDGATNVPDWLEKEIAAAPTFGP